MFELGILGKNQSFDRLHVQELKPETIGRNDGNEKKYFMYLRVFSRFSAK